MNGVLHSEHVISRSGIRGFSTKVKRGHSLSCSSERWRCVSFNHLVVVRKRGFFCTNARRKAGVPTVNWAECTPAMHSIQFFYANFRQKLWQKIFKNTPVCGVCATAHSRSIRKIRIFTGHIGCSIVLSTWYLVLCLKPSAKYKEQDHRD
jgi:hypothetical protein